MFDCLLVFVLCCFACCACLFVLLVCLSTSFFDWLVGLMVVVLFACLFL